MAKGPKPKSPAPPLARLFADLPVDDGQVLQFDFEGVAKTLAELALNPENRTPFTVAVRGGWGRGKTTLLKRAKWILEHPQEVTRASGLRRVETLWFNAWKYPDDDTVLAGLLGALLDRLHKGGLGEQFKILVDQYSGSLVRSVLYLAAPAPLKDLIPKEGLESRFSPVEQKRAFHDTFRDLFSQVSCLLFEPTLAVRDGGSRAEQDLWSPEKQERRTLAIFLDDLDRCRQGRVAEVLEAINLFLDLPGVCFYLGLDWERLVSCLPEPLRAQGDQYLEKIVQVALDLPAVSAGGAGGFVRDLVGATHLDEVIGVGELAVVTAALESRHPRHIKRFLNDLSMTLAVLRNAGKLGSSGGQVPAGAVLVWHLLAEVLAPSKWREVRALPANVRGLLREVSAHLAVAKETEEAPAEWQRLRARGLEAEHFQRLEKLSEEQLHVLVYLASPATAEGPRGAGPGRVDLLDLESAAWVRLEGGSFAMGSNDGEESERPVHQVTLSPFLLSRYPVTNADYAAYVRETDRRPPDSWQGGEVPAGKASHPVVRVSWSDAEAFCTWLSRRVGAGDGERGVVQLPTEAQWEFAARGTEGRQYPWGQEEPDSERANFGRLVGDTTPVGSYPQGATPEGVHDLAGNVWEWCRDWFGAYEDQEQIDPSGPERGTSYVLRGGSFSHGAARGLRGAYRSGGHPGGGNVYIGFRVVWSRSAGLERA